MAYDSFIKKEKDLSMSYQKTEDLLDLAIWMQSTREGVSIVDIMNRFGVSRRTAERMRDMIVCRFVQAEEVVGDDRYKRWRIPQGTLKDFFQITADELSALELAKGAFDKEHLYSQSDKLRSVIEKIRASIKSETYRKIEPDAELLLEAQGFVHRPGPKLKIDSKVMETIQEAIMASKKLKIEFRNSANKTTKHTVAPYGFLYGNKHYLVAFSYYNRQYRYYALHKLVNVKLLDEYFIRDEGFSLREFTKDSFGVFKEEPFEVEWLFNKEVADDASHYIFHPSQTMIKNPDGTLTVKFKAGGRKEMEWHLYTWGDNVKVIKMKNKDE